MIYPKAVFHFASVNFSYYLTPLLFIIWFSVALNTQADNVKIVAVKPNCENQVCSFEVTLEHQDTGWDHYADYWRVITENDQELGKRVLLHPHVNEQPFTRSLSGVEIPSDINVIWIEAHDSVHGVSPTRFKVEL